MIPTTASLAEWPQLTAYRVLVTPAMAQEWLDAGNIDNRLVRPSVVLRYAQMMKGGEWKPTHQGVAFSARRLIDGQHRLMAVVRSGVAQWMIVFVGQPDETFGVLDRGAARLLRDDMDDLPSGWVDALSFLGYLFARNTASRVASPAFLNRLRQVFEPTIHRLNGMATNNVAKRTSAAIRGAIVARHFAASKVGALYIEEQYRAWVQFRTEEMSPSIASLVRRMDNASAANGRTAAYDRAAITWIAFDPENRDLSKILLRDHNRIMNEIREVVAAAVGDT